MIFGPAKKPLILQRKLDEQAVKPAAAESPWLESTRQEPAERPLFAKSRPYIEKLFKAPAERA